MILEINDLTIDLDREAQLAVFGGEQGQSGDSKSKTGSGSDSGDKDSGGPVWPADIMGTAGCIPKMDDPFGW